MLKRLAIRAITPLSWGLSRERLARSLQRFSQVEADSAWQMLEALDAVGDPLFRAKLFSNALEEVHHAAIFDKLAREYALHPLPFAAPRRQTIFDSKRGMHEFEAHHFIGEADVYEQFLSYARAASSDRLRNAFLNIRGDEQEHQALAYSELRRMVGSRTATERLILRIRLKRLYQAWLRLGKKTAEAWLTMVLILVYLVMGPLFGPLCRKRLQDSVRD